MIKIGTTVYTPLGKGIVIGEESFYGGKLYRVIVKLDDPSRWCIKNYGDPAFFEREISFNKTISVTPRKW